MATDPKVHAADPDKTDRLVAARRLVTAAVVGSLLAAGILAFHVAYFSGRPVEPPRAVLAAIDGSSLALVPSGRPERLPAPPPAGVDLRYDPGLGFPPPDPAGLLRKGGGP
ncbi:MAG: hypothetical protein PVG78_00950 [Desulfobacterales bacterium]|jgi:hypothetical protein